MNNAERFEHLTSLMPRLNGSDACVETIPDYCSRFRATFPNFPAEVVAQWFFEHNDALHQNSWLEYEVLEFELVRFPLELLLSDCFRCNPFVEQFCEHLANRVENPRIMRITDHFRATGTWPTPPIVLRNIDGEHSFPWGMPCGSPYHLLEGHHRFAALVTICAMEKVQRQHSVWLARLGKAN
jgi:hypothetical protein